MSFLQMYAKLFHKDEASSRVWFKQEYDNLIYQFHLLVLVGVSGCVRVCPLSIPNQSGGNEFAQCDVLCIAGLNECPNLI